MPQSPIAKPKSGAAENKVSGRGGWKTIKWCPRGERELNKRDMTAYEKYCEYCEYVIGCQPAPDYLWYVETAKIPGV